MFPEIDYAFSIASKRRGNWRPEFTVYLRLHVGQGELEWRPFVPQVCFVAQEELRQDFVEPAFTLGGIQVYRLRSPYSLYPLCPLRYNRHTLASNSIIIPLPGCLFTNPRVGLGEKKGGLCIAHFPGHMSPYEEDISSIEFSLEGYFPWRPGEKPDYSDFLAAFSILPELFGVLWQEGLDSGLNEPLGFHYRGRPSQGIQTSDQSDRPESLSETIAFI